MVGALGLGGAGAFWLWGQSGESMAYLGMAGCLLLTSVLWGRLDPERCYLLLDPDGFEEHPAFGRARRFAWSEVSSFRADKHDGGIEMVAFRLNKSKTDIRIGDNYGYPAEELAAILNRRLIRAKPSLPPTF